MSKYLGPADTFIVGDKEYHRGDSVPMSAELRRHHEMHGHRFDDSPEPALIVPAIEAAPLMPPARPMAEEKKS